MFAKCCPRCACSRSVVTTTVVIGEVVLAHIAEAVADKSPSGKVVVNPVKLRAIARLGGITYGLTTDLCDMARPDEDGRYVSK